MTAYRLRGAAVKLETTYATDAVPTATTDAVLCVDIDIAEPISQVAKDRSLIRGPFGQFRQLLGAQFGRVDLTVEVAGFGTAGPTAPTPGLDALLQCCGLSRTVVSGTSVTYAPVSTNLKSVTVYVWQNGSLYKYTGCFGDATLTMNEDDIPTWKFSLWGIYQAVIDQALPTFTTTAYVTPVLTNAQNTATFSAMGYAAAVKSFSMQLNNQIEKLAQMGTTRRLSFVDRTVSGSIELIAPTVAAHNYWNDISNATLGALSIVHGVAAGNIVTIGSTGGLQVSNAKFTEDRGETNVQMDVRLVPVSGNDELSIVVT